MAPIGMLQPLLLLDTLLLLLLPVVQEVRCLPLLPQLFAPIHPWAWSYPASAVL
jgi:hypothetical protein